MSGTTNPYPETKALSGYSGVVPTDERHEAWDEGRAVGDAEGYARGLSDAAARAREMADEYGRVMDNDAASAMRSLADDLDALRANAHPDTEATKS